MQASEREISSDPGWGELEQQETEMGLTAKSSGEDFAPHPAGTVIGLCYSVVDLGTQTGGNFGPKHECVITWESTELMEDGRPFALSKFYTVSLNEKANLYHDLVSWRGRDFTPEELAGFNVANVLGAPAMLTVVHDDKGKARVAGVAKAMKGVAVPEPVNQRCQFSFEDDPVSIPEHMPEWLQKRVMAAQEWSGNSAAPTTDAREGGFDSDDFDDSIPF